MNNSEYLLQLQNSYESLKNFSINDNKLYFKTDKMCMITLNNVNLSSLNPNIFLLKPEEIFHILYAIELLPNNNITNEEEEFLKNYTQRYLKINDRALQENDVDTNLLSSLSIPIYLSSDPYYEQYPSSKLIQNILNIHNEDLENGRGNHKRLVLELHSNPNFIQEFEEDNIRNFEKAGFTTLLLIASTVIATCSYIIYFIINS